MKAFFSILTLFLFLTASADKNCKSCDIEKVKIVNEHLDSLTFQIVKDFLCTFDKSCINNAEYSEWSNETLFAVIDKEPSLFFQVVATGQVDNKLLLREIENPVNDKNIQVIYDKIKGTTESGDLKTEYLNALMSAAKKGGQKLKK